MEISEPMTLPPGLPLSVDEQFEVFWEKARGRSLGVEPLGVDESFALSVWRAAYEAGTKHRDPRFTVNLPVEWDGEEKRSTPLMAAEDLAERLTGFGPLSDYGGSYIRDLECTDEQYEHFMSLDFLQRPINFNPFRKAREST